MSWVMSPCLTQTHPEKCFADILGIFQANNCDSNSNHRLTPDVGLYCEDVNILEERSFQSLRNCIFCRIHSVKVLAIYCSQKNDRGWHYIANIILACLWRWVCRVLSFFHLHSFTVLTLYQFLHLFNIYIPFTAWISLVHWKCLGKIWESLSHEVKGSLVFLPTDNLRPFLLLYCALPLPGPRFFFAFSDISKWHWLWSASTQWWSYFQKHKRRKSPWVQCIDRDSPAKLWENPASVQWCNRLGQVSLEKFWAGKGFV